MCVLLYAPCVFCVHSMESFYSAKLELVSTFFIKVGLGTINYFFKINLQFYACSGMPNILVLPLIFFLYFSGNF